MASSDCTASGARLWVPLALVFALVLTSELLFLIDIVSSKPKLVEPIVVVAASIVLGTVVGAGVLHQGLTNADFSMPMRVAFVFIGFSIALGSLLAMGYLLGGSIQLFGFRS